MLSAKMPDMEFVSYQSAVEAFDHVTSSKLSAPPKLFRNKTTPIIQTKCSRLQIPDYGFGRSNPRHRGDSLNPRSNSAFERVDGNYFAAFKKLTPLPYEFRPSTSLVKSRDAPSTKRPWKSRQDKDDPNPKDEKEPKRNQDLTPELHLHGHSVGSPRLVVRHSEFSDEEEISDSNEEAVQQVQLVNNDRLSCNLTPRKNVEKVKGRVPNIEPCTKDSPQVVNCPILERRRRNPYGAGVLATTNNNLSKAEDYILRQAINSALQNSGQIFEHWYLPPNLRDQLHQLTTNRRGQKRVPPSPSSARTNLRSQSGKTHPDMVTREMTDMKIAPARFQLLDFAEKHEKEKIQVTQLKHGAGKTELRVQKRKDYQKSILSVYLPKIKSQSQVNVSK